MNRRGWPLLLLGLVLVATLLAVLDRPLRALFEDCQRLAEPVDLQSRSALYAKILSLKACPGRKTAVLGDSAVLGAKMTEYGEQNWRAHTLDKIMANSSFPFGTVYNFGINGGALTDVARTVKLVLSARPQLILLGMNLGNFSTLEEKGGLGGYNRPWLRQMEISNEDDLYDESARTLRWPERLESSIDAFLMHHWLAYRVRDFVQWRYFDGPPVEWVRRKARRLNDFFRQDPAETPAEARALNIAKANKHYARVNLAEENPQVQALRAALASLKESAVPTLVFYFPENPEALPELMDPARYLALHQTLETIVQPYATKNLKLMMRAKAPPPADYADHIHFNAAGYRDFFNDNLAPALNQGTFHF